MPYWFWIIIVITVEIVVLNRSIYKQWKHLIRSLQASVIRFQKMRGKIINWNIRDDVVYMYNKKSEDYISKIRR